MTIDGINIRALRYPNPYLQAIKHSKFVECNYSRANLFHAKYGKDTSTSAVAFWQNVFDVIIVAKKTLDELGIPFWISSGTCLGTGLFFYFPLLYECGKNDLLWVHLSKLIFHSNINITLITLSSLLI